MRATLIGGVQRRPWCRPAVLLAVSSVSLCGMPIRAFSTTTTIPQFTSCASPRFDDFSEKVLGEWHWQEEEEQDEGNDSSSMVHVKAESVQEVMRSCGGAVQGMREVPSILSSSANEKSNEEGYYLNRANDGFVYFDKDGSYSCGPVQLNSEGEDAPWISSVSFGKTRMILAQEKGNCERLQVHRKYAGEPSVAVTDETLLRTIPGTVVWDEIVRCRMPSISQPWMTQRLKWERYLHEERRRRTR